MINIPKLPNVKGLVALGKAAVMAHRPELLFGASIVSTLSAVGLAGKAGYDAGVEVERHENTNGMILEPKEKAKMIAPHFIAPAVATIGALGSTTGLHIVHVKEKKQLAASALMAIEEIKTQSKEYSDGLLKTLNDNIPDEEKERVQEEINQNAGQAPEWVVDEKLYLVQDEYTGRSFYSNETRIQNAVNEVNKKLNKDGECDLNTFYMWAGVEELDRGVEVGWSGQLLSVSWEDEHMQSNGEPVRKFIFRTQPTKGFDDTHV